MEDYPQSHETPRERPQPSREDVPRPVQASAGESKPRLSLMLGLLALLVGLLILPYLAERLQYAITRGRERAQVEVARGELAGLPEIVSRYTLVAHAVAPSVVGIDTVRVVQPRDELASLFPQPRFEAQGEGSGVIVDEAGYIVTNYHVIDGATEASVKLSDGRVVGDVQLVGADPSTDIAVLKIDASGLTAAPWGNSQKMQVGDPVLAIGNPFRLERTVTAGIISAKERRGVVGNVGYQDFLQTDAAVNPGNSGGPLVNMQGQVIGINTAIYGQSFQGISFAIPSQLAREIYEQLRETGKVADRGWLGVEMAEITRELAEQLDLKTVRGALVARVLADSPAEEAGIQPGDVIVQWDGQEVTEPGNLALAVARTKPGTRTKVVVLRDGRRREFTLKVGSRPLELQMRR